MHKFMCPLPEIFLFGCLQSWLISACLSKLSPLKSSFLPWPTCVKWYDYPLSPSTTALYHPIDFSCQLITAWISVCLLVVSFSHLKNLNSTWKKSYLSCSPPLLPGEYLVHSRYSAQLCVWMNEWMIVAGKRLHL